jgi:hypothetical protein
MFKFKHSGDLGDIIYSLPTIKALGGGVLYLHSSKENPSFKNQPITNLSTASIESIKPLLEMQDFLINVFTWNGEQVDYDLDVFRNNIRFNNLAISHLDSFNLDQNLSKYRWLNFNTTRKLPRPFVISRSTRYHSNYVAWVEILSQIKENSIFVGLEKEHEIFEYTFNVKIPYYPTPTILDLTETINSCEQLFCNQSLPHAIAEGLHKRLFCEIFRVYPAAVFKEKNTSNYF